jgi:hypothetical protein
MDWLAFAVGVGVGYLLKANPQATADIKAFAIRPLAKLKGKPERRAPKVNDDRKAWAREQEIIGER